MDKPVVLIVDAEALIRISAVHMIEDAGFLALEAPDADDAIKILESRPDTGAVFTDINMTGSMDGLRLAHAIRGRWPPIHLLVTSGRNVEEKLLPVKGRFICKPYSAEQVIGALYELFGYSPAPSGLDSASYQKRVRFA
jgi:CheY-like chemotaxis protein